MPPARLEQGSGALGAALGEIVGAARRRGAAAAAGVAGATGPGFVAEDVAACPDCGGRGWVIVPDGGAGAARRCSCMREALLPRLEEETDIPSRYQRCRLDNFQTSHHALVAARSIAQRWVEEFLSLDGGSRDGGLLFIGPPGVGKTHLAAAALSEVVRRYRVRGRFVDFTSLVYQIQSTFDAGNPETKQSVLEPVLSAEVLVLDELGAQKPSPWVSEILYLVLNGRYTARRPTLFTTNYALDAAAAPPALDRGAGESLGTRIPAMLVSRLWEMARPVVMAGDDFRRVVKSHQHR
jgi:DNA replication protein DnaC